MPPEKLTKEERAQMHLANRKGKRINELASELLGDPQMLALLQGEIRRRSQSLMDAVGVKGPLNGREAVHAFCAWMTTRAAVIHLGKDHNVGAVVELARAFCDAYKLPAARDGVEHLFQDLSQVLPDVTNESRDTCTRPITFDEAYAKILELFRVFHLHRQNHLLARLLEELTEDRRATLETQQNKRERLNEELGTLTSAAAELDKILAGNFTIVHV